MRKKDLTKPSQKRTNSGADVSPVSIGKGPALPEEFLPHLTCKPSGFACCPLYRKHGAGRNGLNDSGKKQSDRSRVGTFCREDALEFLKANATKNAEGFQKPRPKKPTAMQESTPNPQEAPDSWRQAR